MDNYGQKVCILCGSLGDENLREIKDHSISGKTFCVSTCKTCGFRATINPPSEKDSGSFYKSEAYISHSDTRKGIVSYLYHWVRRIMLSRKASLLQRLGADKSVLDIGSGTGYFPSKMKEAGYLSMAVEPDEKAREFSKSTFNLKVEAPQWIFEEHGRKFGYITLWHVLEHIYDPQKYINRFKEMLLPNGYLIIALPNHTSYDAHHYGDYWAAYDVPRHLWHFEPDTFSRFAQKNGFMVCEMKSLPFDSFYNSILSETYKTKKGAFVTGLLHGCIACTQGMLNVKKASSIIYILKKV